MRPWHLLRQISWYGKGPKDRVVFISPPAYANLNYVRKLGEGLEHLKKKLIEMSSLVEAGIQRSIRAVTHKDRGAADEVLENEARINAIEREIDGLAIDLLALHQPMAINLRFIVAALKINTNLERMGDLSVNIAHSARSLIDAPAITPMVDIPHIAVLRATAALHLRRVA